MILVSMIAERRSSSVHARPVNVGGGVLLAGIGIYDFWVSWVVIALYLA